MQLKQATQRLPSMVWFSGFMHEDLHLRAQIPQLVHFEVSILCRKTEYRDINPRTVPTGHTVLHQILPFLRARKASTTRATRAAMKVGRLFIHTEAG